MNNGIDLTDKRFGRLVVHSLYGKSKDRKLLWLCKCDCGHEVIVRSYSLRKGFTRSCGCLYYDSLDKVGVKKGTRRGPYRTDHHTGIYSYLNKA